MKSSKRQWLADWLASYTGVEILHDRVLDQLKEVDVRYDRFANALSYLEDGRVRHEHAGTLTDEELHAMIAQAERGQMRDVGGGFRAVPVLTLAVALCKLADVGDPTLLLHGDLTRFHACIRALKGD